MNVRLSEFELNAMKEIFLKHFAKEDKLWLFGSRVDLEKRGGDIDIFIETACEDFEKIVKNKLRFLVDLKMKIGDQKIDVVIEPGGSHDVLPIYSEAKRTGVRII